jgi:hypothetical protein
MVAAPVLIGTSKAAALDGLFERLVLIDKIDPVAGEARKNARENEKPRSLARPM